MKRPTIGPAPLPAAAELIPGTHAAAEAAAAGVRAADVPVTLDAPVTHPAEASQAPGATGVELVGDLQSSEADARVFAHPDPTIGDTAASTAALLPSSEISDTVKDTVGHAFGVRIGDDGHVTDLHRRRGSIVDASGLTMLDQTDALDRDRLREPMPVGPQPAHGLAMVRDVLDRLVHHTDPVVRARAAEAIASRNNLAPDAGILARAAVDVAAELDRAAGRLVRR